MNFDEVKNQSKDHNDKKKPLGEKIDVSEIVANSFKQRTDFLDGEEKSLVKAAGLDKNIVQKDQVRRSLRSFLDIYDKTKKNTEENTRRELISQNSALQQQLDKLTAGEEKKATDLISKLRSHGVTDEIDLEDAVAKAKKLGQLDEI